MKKLYILVITLILNSCQGINFGIPPERPLPTLEQQHIYYFCSPGINSKAMQSSFEMPWGTKWSTREDYCLHEAKVACEPNEKIDRRIEESCNYWRIKYHLYHENGK